MRERHYFAVYDTVAPNEPVNFFRVDLSANTRFTNTRYVTGFYDERAVDLFFSEIKGNDKSTLFQNNLKSPGTDQVLKPLDPDVNGTLVMVLSTNADDIVSSISAFAESQVVGQAVTQIANGQVLRGARASQASASAQRAAANAFVAELNSLVRAAGSASTANEAKSAYLRLLQRIATETQGRGDQFATFDEALAWFQAMHNAMGAGP